MASDVEGSTGPLKNWVNSVYTGLGVCENFASCDSHIPFDRSTVLDSESTVLVTKIETFSDLKDKKQNRDRTEINSSTAIIKITSRCILRYLTGDGERLGRRMKRLESEKLVFIEEELLSNTGKYDSCGLPGLLSSKRHMFAFAC